jgi:hypothetical protein
LYCVPGANSVSGRSTISRRPPNVALTFTDGVIAMFAEASAPTADSAMTSFVKNTRIGE